MSKQVKAGWVGQQRLKCRLKQIMDSRGVSQRKLCLDTGLSNLTVAALYHDRALRYDGETLVVLLSYFGIGLSDLFEVECAGS